MQLKSLFPEGEYGNLGNNGRIFQVNVSGVNQVVATESGSTWTLTAYGITLAGLGAKNGSTVTANESGVLGGIQKTILTLAALPQAIVNTTAEYAGTKIYTFPQGRILLLGALASVAQTTTTTIATSIAAGATGAFSLGSAVASATSLTGDMVDMLPSTAYTSSATINVQAAVSAGALAASAQFDGTTTAKDVYFNTAIATGSIDGAQTFNGTVTLTWINLGDY